MMAITTTSIPVVTRSVPEPSERCGWSEGAGGFNSVQMSFRRIVPSNKLLLSDSTKSFNVHAIRYMII